MTFDPSIAGTLDSIEPALRARGYVAVRTMAGPIDLSTFDPYGMRRLGSVNIQSEKWIGSIYHGILATVDGKPYLADATEEGEPRRAESPFVCGLFPLLTAEEVDA